MKRGGGMDRRDFIKSLGAAGGLGLPVFRSSLAFGADWPTKPIRVTIGYAVGGGTDVFIRGVCPRDGGTLSAARSRRAICRAPWRRLPRTLS